MAFGSILGQTPPVPTANDISYNNSSTSSTITSNNVQGAIDELFTSVSNGKALVASAITGKGIATSSDATFQTMASNIEKIQSVPDISNWNYRRSQSTSRSTYSTTLPEGTQFAIAIISVEGNALTSGVIATYSDNGSEIIINSQQYGSYPQDATITFVPNSYTINFDSGYTPDFVMAYVLYY